MRTSQVTIDSPCHESWDAMEGDSERRFCGVCEKHVHDLSAMRHDEAQALLQATAGERLCVRYAAEDDGSLRFRDLVPKSRLTRGLRRAAFAAVMLAGCSPQGNRPISELVDVAASSIREAAVSTPDGGCNVTTGPFTTFHLPPGHALCGPAGPVVEVAAPIVEVAAPWVDVTTPVVTRGEPLPEPFPAAGEPELEVAPVMPPVRMGQAVAQPERVDPFEPCDPPTKFAAPPPSQPKFAAPPMEVEQPPRRMGDIAVPEPRIMGARAPDPARHR